MAVVSSRSFSVEETKRYAASISDPSRMAQSMSYSSQIVDQMNTLGMFEDDFLMSSIKKP